MNEAPDPPDDDSPKPDGPTKEISQPETPLPKQARNKAKILIIAVIALAVGIAIAVGIWFAKNGDKQEPKIVSSADVTITIPGGKEIPETDCEQAKEKVGPDIFGDKCYEAEFAIGGERITYVVIAQSEEDYKQREAACEIDCGSDFGGPSRVDFVIRANGDVENVPDGGLLSAEMSVGNATGCEGLLFYDLDDTGEKLIKKDGRIGVGYHIKDTRFTDQFGNGCIIDTEFSTFVTEPDTVFDSLRVRYDLRSPASCDKAVGLSVQACYENQAVLRNDIDLCDKADFGPGKNGKVGCISGVAERSRDSSYCGRIADESLKSNCERNVAELIEEFQNTSVVYD